MPAPRPSLLIALVEDMVSRLGMMGRERGYRRDYRGVSRVLYAFGLESDLHHPLVQVQLGESENDSEERTDLHRNWDEVVIQVHVPAEEMPDGTLDVVTPVANVRADIFQALMVGGVRHRGSERATTYRRRSEAPPIAPADEPIGATVREIYALEWDHSSEGMDIEPGG